MTTGPARWRAALIRIASVGAGMSLKARMLVTIAVMMAAIVGAADQFELWSESADRTELLENRATMLTTILAGSLAQPLWNFSDEQIDATLAAATRSPDFMTIEVRGIDNRILAARKAPNQFAAFVESRRDIVYTDQTERQTIGRLTLRLSKANIEAVYYHRVQLSLIKFALMLVATIGATYAALRLITEPLGRMTDIMTRLAAGERGLVIPATERRDEIGAMARAVEVFKQNAAEVQRLSIEGERFRAREKEQLLRRRFEQAIDSTAQAIALFDAQNRLVACNTACLDLHKPDGGPRPGMKSIVGRTAQELLDLRIRNGLYKLSNDDRETFVADRLALSTDGRGERTTQLADGRWLHINHRRTPDGGSVYVISDVTNLKAAEAKRLDLEAQLHHSQRLEALGTLAGGIAHDLNNTLVPILGLTRLAADSLPEDSRARKSLAIIAEAGARAKHLVNQILAFSRKEQRQLRHCDLGGVVREAVTLLRSAIPATVRIEQDLAEVPAVEGDDGQLLQVIVNLINNASQAIGRNPGVISISLHKETPGEGGGAVHLTVRDTGCGMDEATRVRVFEPFFSTKPVNEGTGLGLSVAHGIVVAHGGEISVTSQSGQGSAFHMVLPVAQQLPGSPESERARPVVSAAA